MADKKDEIKIKTKATTTQTTQEGVSGGEVAGGGVPGRKLTPRGNLSQSQTAGEQVPRRKLTPRGTTPLENGEAQAGQPTESSQASKSPRPSTQEGQPAAPAGAAGQGQGQNQTQMPQKSAAKQEPTAASKSELKPDHSLSPSVSDADLKNKKGINIPTSKQDMKDKAAQKATEPAKKALSNVAKKLARQAAQAVARLAAQAAAYVVAFFGWWVLIIIAVIVILVLIFSLYLYSTAANGYFGKAQPVAAGTASTNSDVKKAIDYSQKPTDVAGYNQLMFLVTSDKDYMANSGKIDARLVKALNYLISKHKMIRISHIISDYDLMNTNETGSDTNPQIIANITAHKDGLAADTDEIDFVYKTVEFDAKCQSGGVGAIAGALGVGTVIGGVGTGDSDIVYYNDLNQELLRLYCQASITDIAKDTNTIFKGQPAQAIPIKILWQDCKPNIKHAGNQPDPCTTITDPVEQLVFQKVYQPEARRKVHQAITELLQWPYDSGNKDYYRITQLITYSYSRDVAPWEKDGTLDQLYGLPRPANYGLFYMLEAWQNIHIGY